MKDVLILTGAGQISLAIARRIGDDKKIIVGDWNIGNANNISQILNMAGFDAVPFKMDLSNKDSILEMIDEARKYGEVAMLVNGAGVSPSQASIEQILKIDLYGTAVLLEEVGKVINEEYFMKQEKNIDYFQIEGTPGGNQEWCTDFWMYLGGCGALAACDLSICLARNYGLKKCYPGDALNLTRKEYVDFSMKMKPYIHPRVGGVTKLSMFTDGCGQYLKDCGYGAEFETLDGDKPYEEAEKFVKKAIERNLPVIYLMLRHRDKEFKDLNWHWFCITGYKTEKEEVQQRQIKNSCIHTASIQANEMNKNKIKEGINLEERVYLNYHTYGEALSVDFKRLWNTGMYKRGGMVALKSIK